MSPRLHLLTSPLLVGLLAGQNPLAGFRQSVTQLPPTASCVLHTQAGVVWFDGSDLVLAITPQHRRSLLHLPNPSFGSFTITAGPNQLLFGENSTGTVWLVPLQGPRPAQPLTTIAWNYDAVLLDSQHALVSARTGGFGAAVNELLSLDLTTGAAQLVAQVPGASGPLEIGPGGDLFYATAALTYPPPAGAANVVRFGRSAVDQAIAGGPALGIQDATITAGGFDAASDLTFDDDGDLYLVDWFNNRIGAIAEAEQSSAALPTWPLDYAGSWTGPTTLQFVPGNGSGHFEPFQPTNGRLIVHETDWFSVSQTRALEARRPELSGPAPAPLAAGSHALKLADGPAGGVAVFALDLAPIGTTTLLNLPGFAQPLWWNSSLMASPMLVVEPLSPLGRAAIFVTNPGFVTPVPALAQVVTFSTDGVIGSSGEVAMTLQ